MKDVKSALKILSDDYRLVQKRNFFRFYFSRKKEILNYQPVILSIVATGRCTLACDMCPTHSRSIPKDYEHTQKTKTDMEFDMFRDIIDRFDKALSVHIIGSGEPLLNKDLFRMIEYAADKKTLVKTISNGTLLSQNDNIDKILSSKLEGITVSLNGHNNDEFSRMTGMEPRIYDEIYNNVKALIEKKKKVRSGVKVKLSFILDRENVKYVDAMVAASLKLGADHTFFCNFLPSRFDGFRPEERVLFDDEHLPGLRAAYNKLNKGEKRKFTFPPLLGREKTVRECNTHFSQMRVDGKGNVSSCSMMLLNMEDKGKYYQKDVWNNGFFKLMRRKFMDSKEELPEPCYHCVSNYGVSL